MTTTTAPLTMDTKEILEVLPHGHPFLLIDRVLDVNLEEDYVIAQKNVSFNEPFFPGHFPGAPVMPGVLILEAMAQAGAILYYKRNSKAKIAVLMKVGNAKFRKPVQPGDVLQLHCSGAHWSTAGGRIKAKAVVEEQVVCEADISFALVDRAVI